MLRALIAVSFLLALPGLVRAAEAPSKVDEAQAEAAFMKGLTKRTGAVNLPKANATLDLGERYYFLDPADSKKVIEQAWGNPKGSADNVLGMVFLAGTTPFDQPGWGAVVTYLPTGYVPDNDARSTDYDKILKQLREGEDEDNKERKKEGGREIHLAGWAQPPSYEPQGHTLIWARDLEFTGVQEHGLNYDVRVLGRKGVLSLNVVAGMNELPQVRTAADALRTVAMFDQGSRYADYQQGTDKRAAFGIGGLVLGGAGLLVAQKAGLFAVALLFLKKGLVVILAAGAGAWTWLRRKLGGKKAV